LWSLFVLSPFLSWPSEWSRSLSLPQKEEQLGQLSAQPVLWSVWPLVVRWARWLVVRLE